MQKKWRLNVFLKTDSVFEETTAPGKEFHSLSVLHVKNELATRVFAGRWFSLTPLPLVQKTTRDTPNHSAI